MGLIKKNQLQLDWFFFSFSCVPHLKLWNGELARCHTLSVDPLLWPKNMWINNSYTFFVEGANTKQLHELHWQTGDGWFFPKLYQSYIVVDLSTFLNYRAGLGPRPRDHHGHGKLVFINWGAMGMAPSRAEEPKEKEKPLTWKAPAWKPSTCWIFGRDDILKYFW